MPESPASTVVRYETGPVLADDASQFDRLKELVANGYVPDAGAPGEAGILLRHRSAPDLVLYPDGRIEVPLGQPAKASRRFFQPRTWFWTLALIVLGLVFWFVSIGLSLSVLEWMEGI